MQVRRMKIKEDNQRKYIVLKSMIIIIVDVLLCYIIEVCNDLDLYEES